MSDKLKTVLALMFSDEPVPPLAISSAKASEDQLSSVEGSEPDEQPPGSAGWLGAALGTPNWPVAPGAVQAPPQAADLEDAASTSSYIRRKGASHG